MAPSSAATTGDAARTGRAALELVDGGPRRCVGVARIRQAGTRRYSVPIFCRMNPNFDMTGVMQFTELEPETDYEYQMGFLYDDFEQVGDQTVLDWTGRPAVAFRTAATERTRPRSFVFGSCRYLLRLFGGSWFDDRGDKTFRSILNQIDQGVQTNALLMLGDQIYADDLFLVAKDEQVDEFLARYRAAFSQPYIRALMERLPTYMTLDDHEIEDNWPAMADERDSRVSIPRPCTPFSSTRPATARCCRCARKTNWKTYRASSGICSATAAPISSCWTRAPSAA